jgi:hypothetical protein
MPNRETDQDENNWSGNMSQRVKEEYGNNLRRRHRWIDTLNCQLSNAYKTETS